MVKNYFINIFTILLFSKCFYSQYISELDANNPSTQQTPSNIASTPFSPSQIIQNAHDLSLKIESLSIDITEYLGKLSNKSCSDGLLNNVKELYNNVTNILNDMTVKQNNITIMGDEISKIKNAAVCMKNSMCVESPTQSMPPILSTIKPFDNTTCDQLNQNGVISNGDKYENINCQWNINATQSKYISLTIDFLYIQGNVSLKISDKFHGNVTEYNKSVYQPITLQSPSNNYQISVASNDAYSGTSFKLSYSTKDVCYQNYCQNNGTCIVKPDNTPSCQCQGCFKGDTCNEAYDTCTSYTKCLQAVNPNNICKSEETASGCIARCYCGGSSTPTAFCRS
uniref:EGF-like domain-containing protein n=1 Tax=Strongyloides papillosus TaxID=174720 RepID=A0A0N5BNY2_STREA